MDKIFAITLAVLAVMAQFTDAKPVYQYLEPLEGHVPVYIRFGDQSLAEINPSLAEAFGEIHELSARNIKSESEPSSELSSSNFDVGSLMPSTKQIEDASKNVPSIPFFADKVDDSKSSQETTTKKE